MEGNGERVGVRVRGSWHLLHGRGRACGAYVWRRIVIDVVGALQVEEALTHVALHIWLVAVEAEALATTL
jgi:hypothetical protein